MLTPKALARTSLLDGITTYSGKQCKIERTIMMKKTLLPYLHLKRSWKVTTLGTTNDMA
jgi:hypothetical protein